MSDPCQNGCNGCDDCTDYDEEDGEIQCQRCRGDGRDPWSDYLLPCPECLGDTVLAAAPARAPTSAHPAGGNTEHAIPGLEGQSSDRRG